MQNDDRLSIKEYRLRNRQGSWRSVTRKRKENCSRYSGQEVQLVSTEKQLQLSGQIWT